MCVEGGSGKEMDVSHPWQLCGAGKVRGEREKGEAVGKWAPRMFGIHSDMQMGD